MSQQWMKFRFIALILAAVFALSMISLPVWAEDGGDATPGENETPINLNNIPLEPAQQLPFFPDINENLFLYGDIRIGSETEQNQMYPVTHGQQLPYTGVLDINPIKDKITQVKENFLKKYPNFDMEKINVKKVSSTFTTKLTLPEGLSFGPDSATGTFSDEVLFKVVETPKIAGKTITIKMDLIEQNYGKFMDLYRDVTSAKNPFTFTVPDIQVDADAAENMPLTAVGTVEGSFSGTAYVSFIEQNFNYTWTAVQSEAGRDAIKPAGDEEITFTVIVNPAPEEEQDILIPCPYPCQVPPMWNPQPQPSQMIQQVQPMPQAPVQNVDAAQAPIQLPKTGEKRPQPLSLFFLLSASALFLLRRKMR